MLIIIALSMLILGLLGLLYPFVIYPLLLTIATKKKQKNNVQNDRTGIEVHSYVLVFCAYNEEKSLEEKIKNIRELKERYKKLKVRAYSDGSSDRTNEILLSAVDILDAVASESRRGKSVGMNTLVAGSDEDVVIFTDANVILSDQAIRELVEPLRNPAVGVTCGSIAYERSAAASATINRWYWAWEEFVKAKECLVDTAIGADGSAFAIRRDLFRVVPDDIIDDFFTSMSIVADGYRCVQCPKAVVHEAQVKKTKDEFQRKVRIACRAFNCHRLLWPRLRMMPPLRLFMYLSHKVVRWFSGIFLALAVAGAVLLSVLWLGWIATLSMIVAFGLLVILLPKMRGLTIAVASAFVAPTFGVLRSLQGMRYATWRPAESGR